MSQSLNPCGHSSSLSAFNGRLPSIARYVSTLGVSAGALERCLVATRKHQLMLDDHLVGRLQPLQPSFMHGGKRHGGCTGSGFWNLATLVAFTMLGLRKSSSMSGE
jgi:hypothetical protein